MRVRVRVRLTARVRLASLTESNTATATARATPRCALTFFSSDTRLKITVNTTKDPLAKFHS